MSAPPTKGNGTPRQGADPQTDNLGNSSENSVKSQLLLDSAYGVELWAIPGGKFRVVGPGQDRVFTLLYQASALFARAVRNRTPRPAPKPDRVLDLGERIPRYWRPGRR
jgi:hypothetical protein